MKNNCPCGTSLDYETCCGSIHQGIREARTALELMRS
ncbi:MAG: SEC-C motif-containing protein, partial [Luteibaculaceae bacterium]